MPHVIDEDETYTYEIVQEKHVEESCRLLADTFTKYNPLKVYLKTTYEQLYPQVLAYSKAVINEQLSIVALHKQTKEIHGIVQAGDAKKLEEQNFEESASDQDTLEVFYEVEERFMKEYTACPANGCHAWPKLSRRFLEHKTTEFIKTKICYRFLYILDR